MRRTHCGTEEKVCLGDLPSSRKKKVMNETQTLTSSTRLTNAEFTTTLPQLNDFNCNGQEMSLARKSLASLVCPWAPFLVPRLLRPPQSLAALNPQRSVPVRSYSSRSTRGDEARLTRISWKYRAPGTENIEEEPGIARNSWKYHRAPQETRRTRISPSDVSLQSIPRCASPSD